MAGLIIVGALLAAFALTAPRYGADSHTSDGWTAGRGTGLPRARSTVRADLAALRVAVAGVRGRRRVGLRP
jgi:hypothetical protein